MDQPYKSGMSVSVLVAGLLMAWGPTHVTCLPDLSWDYTQHDILLTLDETAVTYIKKTRYNTEDMPITCRQDVCKAANNSDEWKGSFAWPRTPVGYRVKLRCPYSFDRPQYAVRDCVLNDDLNATWSRAIHSECTGPPLWETIDSLQVNLTNMTDKSDTTSIVKTFYLLYNVIRRYPDTPVSPGAGELKLLFSLTSSVLSAITSNTVSMRALQDIINVADFLLDERLEETLDTYLIETSSLLNQLTVVKDTIRLKATGQHFNLTSWNERVIINAMSMRQGQSEIFLNDDRNEVTIEVPEDAVDEEWITMMFFTSDMFEQLIRVKPGLRTKPVASTEGYTRAEIPLMDVHSISLPEILSLKGISLVEELANSTDESGKLGDPNDWELQHTSGYAMFTGFLYIGSSMNVSNSSQGPVIIHRHKVYSHETGDEQPRLCARTPFPGRNSDKGAVLGTWYHFDNHQYCGLAEVGGNRTTCRCRGGGFLGLFFDKGFPYIRELYFASHVFRAVSLVCLILTLLTFACFRNVRRGRPTHILIQLCLSLIALLIVLYIAQTIGATKLGCVAANVLRYYFVLVSLLWNGVEAYNMYLMLVKVFDHNTHRLVTKAAFVAWGSPAVAVALILGIDQKGFHGGYVDCKFKCKLPDSTLYYGFLLPMGIIILHNFVIFVLVTKVLINSAHAPVRDGKDQLKPKRVSWQQLCGAVAMLVLLGVPWMFSAFGAVSNDAHDSLKTLEAVFQIVFAVFINLQGMFIFIFHCARIPDIRTHWRSALSSAKTSDIPLSSSSIPPTN